ncbi:MAG: hypothetical protein LBR73_09475 [Oscillospiraceae bacterium]|jgi:hypothetical protein|nr:hypothetical protein [Oscillospiraceae bacterium]
MQDKYEEYRRRHPVFHYNRFSVERREGCIALSYDFSIDGLTSFRPETIVYTDNLDMCNACDSPVAQDIAFCLGLVELISYWKCACPPTVRIHCGHLTADEIEWWKRLWYNGLGEFFYRNGIHADQKNFLQVQCTVPAEPRTPVPYNAKELSLVPVGGGKDSCVTLQLLHDMHRPLMGFTVNDQAARTETFEAASYPKERILRTKRTIAPELLQTNKDGYFNGHTPFSAIVAFLGLYGAYTIGAEDLVLSNEASANEATVPGLDVNHQYSKSYAFESDMNTWITGRFGLPIRYFSLLRPFHELQIAKFFSAYPQYHKAFKSCNVGSKQNIWCCNCAKCLFVYLMLKPFLSEEALIGIFGENLMEKPSLQDDLQSLLGKNETKPFECVGTVDEATAAFNGRGLQRILNGFNREHNIPNCYSDIIERMYNDVRSNS